MFVPPLHHKLCGTRPGRGCFVRDGAIIAMPSKIESQPYWWRHIAGNFPG